MFNADGTCNHCNGYFEKMEKQKATKPYDVLLKIVEEIKDHKAHL